MDAPSPTMFADYWLPTKPDEPEQPPCPTPDPVTLFGFIRADDGTHSMPPRTVALQAVGEQTHDALIGVMKTMGVPSLSTIWSGDRRVAFYMIGDPATLAALTASVPEAVTVIGDGQPVDLSGFSPEAHAAKSIDELSELTAAAVRELTAAEADPLNTRNPLLPFSLRGQSEKFKRMAVEARPLLGDVCLRGQVTVWYAAPNTGKTLVALSLILDAVREGRIAAGNVFYVNADDNGQGFATKLQIMDDLGSNTLAPGFNCFRAPELITLLHKMADQNEARGLLVVIDTAKKFVDLMSKSEASQFAQACRRAAMTGGTILGLAHTTKNTNTDGTPRYAGTGDLVDDADAAYTLKLLDHGGGEGEKVVEFRCFKSRGNCAEIAAYAFAAEKGVSYEEKLASVRPIEPAQLDEFQRVEAERSDAELIEAVAGCIGEGINTKMLLMKEAAARTGVSGRAIGRLERFPISLRRSQR